MSSEKRRHPRVARQLTVDIDGLEVFTTNISLGGMQVECPALRFHAFQRLANAGPIPLCVRLPARPVPILSQGAVRYADPAGDGYLVGLEFVAFSADSEVRWGNYIEELESLLGLSTG
ncbi:MAG: PilZ domain-containing protein [Gammaproteobacteria bacterium]|nr:PilZ domain-containing protein [Gammaproteobacteria bacterium]MBI5616200.1 PilZ domain-containing protein [Gammaproteobacteria bacterium]